MGKLIAALVIIAALVAGWLWAMLQWSYSTGDRAGWVQKFSHKGWLCKTWEGELALVSLPGSSVEKFYFTVRDDKVAEQLGQLMGKRVSLHYEEKVGLPTTCFGETRYYVTKAVVMDDIPLGTGMTIPQPHGQASAPAAQVPVVPTVPVTPVQPAPAASR